VKVGIVGHEAAKFTPETEAAARRIIRGLLADPAAICVSGECHLGGVDIYAKEEALAMGRGYIPFPPQTYAWPGYKERNLQIAAESDVVHVIVVRELPPTYRGMRFKVCYHCGTSDHVKSGGCWTALRAMERGKRGEWHVV
jgi:hypothetical protein